MFTIMTKKNVPRGIRKFIRREKARIRREVSDLKERQGLIEGLRRKYLKHDKEPQK